jgi:hypothetical protein
LFYLNLQIVEGCQYLVEVEQDLTKSSNCWKLSVFGRSRTSSDKIFKLFFSEPLLLSTKNWPLSTIWRFF